jgi:ankyrin repeat protein
MKTGLHIAVEQGQDEMVDYLIKRGARTDCRDKTLKTPLHLACLSGNIEIARILI